MRKIVLHPNDFELFDNDITQPEFEFFQRHKDVFKQMFVEQGREFWVRFVMTFRKFSLQYGIIRNYPKEGAQYEEYIDQAFINIHENFVEVRNNQAIRFLLDIVVVAQFRPPEVCNPKTTAGNPFYMKHTRDGYRNLFGDPKDKASYIRVYALLPLFLRFGGSICKCLRRWREAPELQDGEEYWTFPEGEKDLTKPSDIPPKEGPYFELYLQEKLQGHPQGPMFMGNHWPPKHHPKTHFEGNPMFEAGASGLEDWREELEYEDFVRFYRWCKANISCVDNDKHSEHSCKHCQQGGSGKRGGKKKKRGSNGGGVTGLQHIHLSPSATAEARAGEKEARAASKEKQDKEKTSGKEKETSQASKGDKTASKEKDKEKTSGKEKEANHQTKDANKEDKAASKEKEANKETSKAQDKNKEKETKKEKEVGKAEETSNGKEVKKESVKEKETKKETVKEKETKKEDVREKETKKEDAKEKEAKKEDVKEKEAKKEDVREKEAKKESVKKKETKKEDVREKIPKKAGPLTEKEAIKAALKSAEDAQEKVPKKAGPLTEKEAIKAALKSAEDVREKVPKKAGPITEKDALKAALKSPEVVQAADFAIHIRVGGGRTHHNLSEEQLKSHPWVLELDRLEASGMSTAEALIAAAQKLAAGELGPLDVEESYHHSQEKSLKEDAILETIMGPEAVGPGEGADPFATQGGSFKFTPKKDGEARFSKIKAAEHELDRELVARSDAMSIPITPDTDFSKIEMFDRNRLLKGIVSQGRHLNRPRSLSSVDVYDSFDAEHVGQMSMYCQNMVRLASEEPKPRMAKVLTALQDIVHCKIPPFKFNTLVLKELPHAPVPLAEEFWKANLLRLQQAMICKETSMPAVPDPTLQELHLEPLLSKVNKTVGITMIDRARECRYFLRMLFLYAYHKYNVAKKRYVIQLIQDMVDIRMPVNKFVEAVCATLAIPVEETWITLIEGLMPSFRNSLLAIEVELEGIRKPPDSAVKYPPKQEPAQRAYDFLFSLLRLSNKMHSYSGHVTKVTQCIQSLVDETVSFSEFADSVKKMMDAEGYQEIHDLLEEGLPDLRIMLQLGECTLPGIEPPCTQNSGKGTPSEWVTCDRDPNPGSPLKKILELIDGLFTGALMREEKIVKFLQQSLNFLLEENITVEHFAQVIHSLLPDFPLSVEQVTKEHIQPGLKQMTQHMVDGRIVIKDIRTPVLKRSGLDEKTKKRKMDEDGKKLIDYAKVLRARLNRLEIEAPPPPVEPKPKKKKGKAKEDVREKSKQKTTAVGDSSKGGAKAKTSGKPNEKGDGKKKLTPKEAEKARKKKEKEERMAKKELERMLKGKPDPAKSPYSVDKFVHSKDSEAPPKPPGHDVTLWSYVQDLVIKPGEPQETDEQAQKLGNYLEKMLEKCRGKKLDHLVKEANHLVQALIDDTIPEDLFFFLILHIAFDHDEVNVGKQLCLVPLLKGGIEKVREWMKQGKFSLSGIKAQRSDNELYHMLFNEDPMIPYKLGEYRSILKAAYNPLMLEYVDRKGMLMAIPSLDDLPGISQDAVEAASNRVLTREPGVGHQVELCARYIAILLAQARIVGNNPPMVTAVMQLIVMDEDVAKPYYPRDFLKDLDEAHIVPFGTHLHYLLFLNRVHEGLVAAILSNLMYLQDIPPVLLLEAKKRYATKHGLPVPNSPPQGTGIFDKTKHSITRQSEPPVIRPPVSRGQTPSDLQRCTDYLLSIIKFVEEKADPAEEAGEAKEKRTTFYPEKSKDMQKAFLTAKIQDLVDDTLSSEIFLTNMCRLCDGDGIHHPIYVTFLKKTMVPLRKALLSGKVKLPGIVPPRTDDQLYEAHYNKPPPTPFKPDEFKRSLRAPKGSDCPWQEAEPNLHDMAGIKLKMVTEAKSRVEVTSDAIDIDVLKTAQYLAILLVKTLDTTGNENCESLRKLQEVVDGTADMLELYNCMEAEDIIIGKTHDNYAVFFQSELFRVRQCMEGGIVTISGLQPPANDNTLYERIYHYSPLLHFLEGEFKDFLKKRRIGSGVVTPFERRRHMPRTVQAEVARGFMDKLPIPAHRHEEHCTLIQQFVDGVLHPEDYLKKVEGDLMEKPHPMVGWFWPFVPILEVCISPLRDALICGRIKMKHISPPRSAEELYKIEHPTEDLPESFNPDEYKQTRTGQRSVPFRTLPELKRKQAELVVSKKKFSNHFISNFDEDEVIKPLKIPSYLLVSKPIGQTLRRYLDSKMSERMTGKQFDAIYEAASIGLVEVARALIKEMSWLTEGEKATRAKELMHDACTKRYKVTLKKPAGLMCKDGFLRFPNDEEEAKNILLEEVNNLIDEEATIFANYVNYAVADDVKNHPEYLERVPNYELYSTKRAAHYALKAAKRAEESDYSDSDEEVQPREGYNIELIPPDPGSKAISQLMFRPDRSKETVHNLGPCRKPSKAEGIQCWHSARDGTTIMHFVDKGQAEGTTTILTPMDPEALKLLPQILEKLPEVPLDEDETPPHGDEARPFIVKTIPPPVKSPVKALSSEEALVKSQLSADKVTPTSDKAPPTSEKAPPTTTKTPSTDRDRPTSDKTPPSSDKAPPTSEKTTPVSSAESNGKPEESKADDTSDKADGTLDELSTNYSKRTSVFLNGDPKEEKTDAATSSKPPVQQEHQHRSPGHLTSERCPGVEHNNKAEVVRGCWQIPIGKSSVLRFTTLAHSPECAICGAPVPPAAWLVDAENYLDEEPENAGIRARSSDVKGHCLRCRCVILMLQRHHLLPLLSHVFEVDDMKHMMFDTVTDAENLRRQDLIPSIQLKMAAMGDLALTPDHFPHWELQLARRVLFTGELEHWLRTVEGSEALKPDDYVRRYVSNVPEFSEKFVAKELAEYFYDKVDPLAHAFRAEALSWLKGDGGVVLESMYRRYVSNMPASRVGFHMTMPEVDALDKGTEKLLERVKPIMRPPPMPKTPTLKAAATLDKSPKKEAKKKKKERTKSESEKTDAKAASPSPSTAAAKSTASKLLRHCSHCQAIEPALRTYKKCQKCKEMGLKNARYYCSRDCQVADWSTRHKMEHQEGMLVA